MESLRAGGRSAGTGQRSGQFSPEQDGRFLSVLCSQRAAPLNGSLSAAPPGFWYEG